MFKNVLHYTAALESTLMRRQRHEAEAAATSAAAIAAAVDDANSAIADKEMLIAHISTLESRSAEEAAVRASLTAALTEAAGDGAAAADALCMEVKGVEVGSASALVMFMYVFCTFCLRLYRYKRDFAH
jgi:hypothetical protein